MSRQKQAGPTWEQRKEARLRQMISQLCEHLGCATAQELFEHLLRQAFERHRARVHAAARRIR